MLIYTGAFVSEIDVCMYLGRNFVSNLNPSETWWCILLDKEHICIQAIKFVITWCLPSSHSALEVKQPLTGPGTGSGIIDVPECSWHAIKYSATIWVVCTYNYTFHNGTHLWDTRHRWLHSLVICKAGQTFLPSIFAFGDAGWGYFDRVGCLKHGPLTQCREDSETQQHK